MRLEGKTFQAIADALGYSDKSNARQAIMALLAEMPADNAEQIRAMENGRLDVAQRSLMPLVTSDDPEIVVKAVSALVRLSSRRCQMNGADAPVRAPVDEDGNTVGTSDGLDIFVSRIARLVGRTNPTGSDSDAQ